MSCHSIPRIYFFIHAARKKEKKKGKRSIYVVICDDGHTKKCWHECSIGLEFKLFFPLAYLIDDMRNRNNHILKLERIQWNFMLPFVPYIEDVRLILSIKKQCQKNEKNKGR